MKKPVSLGDRIRAAKTEKEIESLLLEGASYQHADPATKRRWKRLAAQRQSALSTPVPKEPVNSEAAPKKSTAAKSKYVAKKRR